MNIHDSLKLSATGLSAERLRMDVISANIANANSTRSEKGGPYRRQVTLLAPGEEKSSFQKILEAKDKPEANLTGVRVVGIVEDPSPPKTVYDPSHPDANKDGYVSYPNVDVMKEMIELITASRAYEANVTALNSSKSMFLKTLEIGRS